MPRGDQITRQWRLLKRIEGAGEEGVTIADLASNENVHERTIRRDVLDLQSAGFPLFDSVSEPGAAARWSVLKSRGPAVQIPFLPSELLALHIAYSGMKAYAGTPFYEAIEELYKKIHAVLPPKNAKFLADVRDHIVETSSPAVDYGPHQARVHLLNQAIFEHRTIRCSYFTLYRNDKTSRLLDPYSLRFHDGGIYLIAYCHSRKDVRTFALQRLGETELTDLRFTVAEGFSMRTYVENAFGVHSDTVLSPGPVETEHEASQLPFWGEGEKRKKGPTHDVEVLFAPALAPLLRERMYHSSQKLIERSDGSVILTMKTSGLVGVERWVLSFADSAKVLKPRELRETVAMRLSAASKQY